MNPGERHQARHYALQALYQWQLTHTPIDEIETQFLIHHIKRKTDLDYFKELIHNIPKQYDELDVHMTPYLDRPIQELDPIELSVLRLATYELLHRPDVPYRVVINEALELTKLFGSIEGHKYVNGILDHIAHKLRATEIRGEKTSK